MPSITVRSSVDRVWGRVERQVVFCMLHEGWSIGLARPSLQMLTMQSGG